MNHYDQSMRERVDGVVGLIEHLIGEGWQSKDRMIEALSLKTVDK